jgi:hypothetical protein
MTRIFLALTLLNWTPSMSQNLSFPKTVNMLFFGVDVANKKISILDSFLSIPKLKHSDTVARQSSLSLSMQMNTRKQAWSSRHVFSFYESPLPDLNIEKGSVEVTIGEAGKEKKLLNLYWHIQFNNGADATNYFEKLKQTFSDISTIKKLDYDKDVGHIAEFSSRKQVAKGISDITLFLHQTPQSNRHEIALLFGNDLMKE